MSLSFLRPLGFGEVLDGGFTIYRRHFTVLFATALLAMLPLSVASGAWVQMLQGMTPESASAGTAVGGGLMMIVVGLISWSVILGAIVRQVAGAVSGGEVSIGDGCRHALRRFLPIAGAFILSTLAAMAGMFAVLLPLVIGLALIVALTAVASGAPPTAMPVVGVILITGVTVAVLLLLMAGFFAVTPAVVIESRGPVAALGRSWRLASGARVRIMGVLLVSWIIIMLPAIAIGMVTGSLTGVFDPASADTLSTRQLVMQQALSLLSSALTLPFFVACMTLLYFDRRVRTEAYDLEAAADALPVG